MFHRIRHPVLGRVISATFNLGLQPATRLSARRDFKADSRNFIVDPAPNCDQNMALNAANTSVISL
jgi:hypothetical protein